MGSGACEVSTHRVTYPSSVGRVSVSIEGVAIKAEELETEGKLRHQIARLLFETHNVPNELLVCVRACVSDCLRSRLYLCLCLRVA